MKVGNYRVLCTIDGASQENRNDRCGRAVQAGGQEVQVVQEGLLPGLAGMVFLEGQLLPEVMGVAAEGREGEYKVQGSRFKVQGSKLRVPPSGTWGEAVLRGQAAVRDPGQEAPVDLGQGGVIADSATFIH